MTISKKNGKYYCRFQINGERHHYLCSGASSLFEAQQIETAFKYKLQQQQNGVIPKENKRIKLSTLLDMFESYSKINKRSYKSDLHMLTIIREYFKDIIAQDVKVETLEKFKEYLLKIRGLKNATVNRYNSVLSKTFNLGIANKLVRENPVRFVGKLKENNYKIRFLTSDEEKRLMEVLPEYLKPIVICALQTGMRRGEIFNLKWSNIDFDYGFIELLETKSGKSRRIPISARLMNILDAQPRINEYVFINPETKKPYNDIKKAWYSSLKKAGIENFRFHDLRHTVATRLADSNIDLVVVKEILGHADIQTTMRYAHAVPQRKFDAISVLNSYN